MNYGHNLFHRFIVAGDAIYVCVCVCSDDDDDDIFIYYFEKKNV